MKRLEKMIIKKALTEARKYNVLTETLAEQPTDALSTICEEGLITTDELMKALMFKATM